MPTESRLPRVGRWYVGGVIAAGAVLIALALYHLVTGVIDPRWLAIAGLTILSASATIKVPALPARISVSETFVFTALLIFGPDAGFLTVAIDGLVASLWIHRRKSYAIYKTLFNVTAPAVALWIAWRLSLGMASVPPLIQQPTPVNYLLPPLFVLALLYFVLNSWLIAFAIAIQTGASPAKVWSGNFLWVAINYFGGASVTVLLILLYTTQTVSAVALGISIPLLTMFYLMFKIGMGRAEDSIAHLTALKLASEQRAALEGQLCQAQKMESAGRLASGVARDFDQLLAPIIARADALLQDARPGEPRREDLLQIRQAAERARGLTTQLLAFGSQQALALAPIDVGAIVGALEPVLRRTARENIRLDMRRRTGGGLVHADAGQIEQALMNLAVNAEDAMPGGGTLTIAADETVIDQARVALDPGLPLGPCVTISVTDTGVGMDADTRSRVCEPFFTTKERGGRTGLGLSAVYGIVKQHGGHLTVDSAPGKGSTFTIVLPRAVDTAQGFPSRA